MPYKPPDDTCGVGNENRVSLTLTPPILANLKKMSRESHISVSRLVRHMIEYCLDGGDDAT